MIRRRRWMVLLLVAALAVAGALLWGGGDLGQVTALAARLGPMVQAHFALIAGLYFLAYVAAVTLSLPVATVMTLAAGALFGFWPGLVLVSFASSIGATLAFLLARWLFRDAVAARFGDRLARVEEGFRRDGAFYLFTLRLVPAIAFFVVNLLFALTPIRAVTFYAVSQLAMLPATAVYVNAGTQLARIESLSDILSPATLLALALLGLIPLILRFALRALSRHRVYKGFLKPKSFDRNLIVIGAGAGGLVASYTAATARAKVTLIEAGEMGGDCLNHGCVPSKALIRSARVAATVAEADRWGIGAQPPEVDFPAVIARIRDVIVRIAPHDGVERYSSLGVEVIRGHARLVDPWTVEIDGGTPARLTSRAIVLATGSEPAMPDIPGLAEHGALTADTLWDHLERLDRAPERMLILGGGVIACELGLALARLGSKVVLIERGSRILSREDGDVAEAARQALERAGVEIRYDTRILSVYEGESGKLAELSIGDPIGFDALLVAAGRTPRTTGMGLEDLGIRLDGAIETDAYLRTNMPNILAAGDSAGPPYLTHAAGAQGTTAALNALIAPFWRLRSDLLVMPKVIFLDPEIATVGLTGTEVTARNIPHEITRYSIDDLDRAIAEGRTEGFVKLLTRPGSDKLLGVTIVGDEAGELIAQWALAMRHRLGAKAVLGTTHAYPTRAEAGRMAAGAWARAHAPERLLGWAARFHDWRRG